MAAESEAESELDVDVGLIMLDSSFLFSVVWEGYGDMAKEFCFLSV